MSDAAVNMALDEWIRRRAQVVPCSGEFGDARVLIELTENTWRGILAQQTLHDDHMGGGLDDVTEGSGTDSSQSYDESSSDTGTVDLSAS